MPNRHQFARILEIDRRIRAREYPNPTALAAEFDVQRRIIFNDRAFLMHEMGAPIKYSREHSGWYYSDETWALPSMIFDRGELLALLLGIEASRQQLGPVLQAELLAAVDKISRSLENAAVTVNLDSLRSDISFAPPSAATAATETVLALHEAIQYRRVVEMRYFSAHRGSENRRTVEPHHLHNVLGDWYFFAYEPEAKTIKTFHAGRIRHLHLLKRTFVRQLDFNAEKFIAGGFRAESGPGAHEVAVRFDSAQAPYIRERCWHPTQELQDEPDGGVLLRLRASGLGEITRWILSYGPRAEVLSPPELRSAVAKAASEMVGIYGRDES